MKNPICRHCIHPCKTTGKSECLKYYAKANRLELLQKEIKTLYGSGQHDKAKALQIEIDLINYGSVLRKS